MVEAGSAQGWGVASGPVESAVPPPQPLAPEPARRPVLPFLAAGALLAGAIVFLVGYELGQGRGSDAAAGQDDAPAGWSRETPAAPDEEPDEATTEPEDTDAPAPTPSDAVDDPATEEPVEPGAVEDDPDDDGAADASDDVVVDPADAVRTATFRGGTVFLEGRVPSQEVAEEIAGKAAMVVGEDNVVADYEVDPGAPLPRSAPLLVEDLVLFEYGSAEVQPAFEPLLDLGAELLMRVPGSSLTVVGHTDGLGPADDNLALSQERVDAVVAHLTERGIDPDRVTGIARGEQDLIPGAAPAANRRTEFVINDVLDG